MSCKLCGYLWCYCLYSFMIEINGDKKKKHLLDGGFSIAMELFCENS